jgi:hypothetical protein
VWLTPATAQRGSTGPFAGWTCPLSAREACFGGIEDPVTELRELDDFDLVTIWLLRWRSLKPNGSCRMALVAIESRATLA